MSSVAACRQLGRLTYLTVLLPKQINALVDDKRYWIYKNLAEWRDLNETCILREYWNV